MNAKDVNAEEISLCKQIAEKHQKEIKYGDWYYYSITKNCFVNAPRGFYLSEDEIDRKNITPLWTISDCLEFLREKKWHIVALTDDAVFDEKFQYHCEITDDKFDKTIYKKGKTPLEACLKAVLAVLEEGK